MGNLCLSLSFRLGASKVDADWTSGKVHVNVLKEFRIVSPGILSNRIGALPT